jgi:hypothetical protein
MMGSICDGAALKVVVGRFSDVEFGAEVFFDGGLVYRECVAAALGLRVAYDDVRDAHH